MVFAFCLRSSQNFLLIHILSLICLLPSVLFAEILAPDGEWGAGGLYGEGGLQGEQQPYTSGDWPGGVPPAVDYELTGPSCDDDPQPACQDAFACTDDFCRDPGRQCFHVYRYDDPNCLPADVFLLPEDIPPPPDDEDLPVFIDGNHNGCLEIGAAAPSCKGSVVYPEGIAKGAESADSNYAIVPLNNIHVEDDDERYAHEYSFPPNLLQLQTVKMLTGDHCERLTIFSFASLFQEDEKIDLWLVKNGQQGSVEKVEWGVSISCENSSEMEFFVEGISVSDRRFDGSLWAYAEYKERDRTWTKEGYVWITVQQVDLRINPFNQKVGFFSQPSFDREEDRQEVLLNPTRRHLLTVNNDRDIERGSVKLEPRFIGADFAVNSGVPRSPSDSTPSPVHAVPNEIEDDYSLVLLTIDGPAKDGEVRFVFPETRTHELFPALEQVPYAPRIDYQERSDDEDESSGLRLWTVPPGDLRDARLIEEGGHRVGSYRRNENNEVGANEDHFYKFSSLQTPASKRYCEERFAEKVDCEKTAIFWAEALAAEYWTEAGAPKERFGRGRYIRAEFRDTVDPKNGFASQDAVRLNTIDFAPYDSELVPGVRSYSRYQHRSIPWGLSLDLPFFIPGLPEIPAVNPSVLNESMALNVAQPFYFGETSPTLPGKVDWRVFAGGASVERIQATESKPLWMIKLTGAGQRRVVLAPVVDGVKLNSPLVELDVFPELELEVRFNYVIGEPQLVIASTTPSTQLQQIPLTRLLEVVEKASTILQRAGVRLTVSDRDLKITNLSVGPYGAAARRIRPGVFELRVPEEISDSRIKLGSDERDRLRRLNRSPRRKTVNVYLVDQIDSAAGFATYCSNEHVERGISAPLGDQVSPKRSFVFLESSRQNWSLLGELETSRLARTLAHELGHVLGLVHSFGSDSASPDNVHYRYSSDQEMRLNLMSHDIGGNSIMMIPHQARAIRSSVYFK